MKYFTRQRYLRLGNLDSKNEFLAAQEDWESAVQAYKKHLDKVREGLPSSLRRLIETVYLHDARVLEMSQGRVSRLTITLQPESTPRQLVVLTYSLLQPARVQKNALPPAVCSEPVAWLYDEVGIEPSSGRGKPAAFTHNILLSNGWEVALRFRTVTVRRPLTLIPTAPENVAGQAAVSRSA